MLKKSRRLTTGQIKAAIDKGRISHSPLFLVRLVPGQSDTRISVVAPQKIFKTAVGRNGARRKVYDAIREIFPKLALGYHIAIFAKNKMVGIGSEEIKRDLESFFVKAGLLR